MLHWAEVEAYKLRNKEKVTELMETYITHNGSDSSAWLNYIKFVRFFGDIKLVRTLCKRGLEYCGDYETLGTAWLEWEKKFGTIDTMLDCEAKINKKRLKQMRVEAEQQIQLEANEDMKGSEQEFMRKRGMNEERGGSDSKRKKTDEEESRPPPLSERNTLFINNVAEDVIEDELEQLFAKSVMRLCLNLV